MKEKTRQLIEIKLEVTKRGNNGAFLVTVFNGTNKPIKHTIGIEASEPISVIIENKIIAVSPPEIADTKIIMVPADSKIEIPFSWKSVHGGAITMARARFMHAKTKMIML